MRGRIKWFDSQKGYGFIRDSDGNDIFLHYKQIEGNYRFLQEGDIVTFELGERSGNSRIQAINVKPIITMSMVEKALGGMI